MNKSNEEKFTYSIEPFKYDSWIFTDESSTVYTSEIPEKTQIPQSELKQQTFAAANSSANDR